MVKKEKDILNFPEVCILEASAGSGKTRALAKRYLQLLLNAQSRPENIRNILAITFTNMATREMKERILEFLKKIALDSFSNPWEAEELFSSIPLDKESARMRAYELMDYIIRNYNFFQVQTIDSFINIILTGCSYKLGLSANFSIRQSYEDFLTYSLDECVEKANYNKNTREIFNNFLRQYVYIEGRKSWFPKSNILTLIDSLLYHSNVYGGKFRKFDFGISDLITEKKKIIELLRKLDKNLPPGTDGRFAASLKNFLKVNQEGFDFKNISRYFRRKNFPANKGVIIPEEIESLWEDICKRLTDVAEKEARSLFNCYIDIFQLVYEVFIKYAREEDLFFLQELNRLAMILFGKERITVPELYCRLATRFQHYLIDEFQDTSTLQWQNLFLMIEDALSSGGSLFYVGDKKQAIYRFRGGDVSLFDKIKEDFQHFNIKSQLLNTNYRSQKEIVEFNNTIFSQDNLEHFLKECQSLTSSEIKRLTPGDVNEIIDIFQDSHQGCEKDKSYGYVEVEPLEVSSEDEEEEVIREKLLNLLGDLRQRFRLKDIAILSRRNKEVELISSWLIENNIAVESEKTLDVRENYLIKELVSFLKFLNSPIDNLSFSSFILGEVFTRAAGVSKEEMENFILKHREKLSDEKPFYLYRSFRKFYPEIWRNYIEDFFKAVGFVDLYELVISILQRFNVLENFGEYQGFFMHLLELVKKKEEECIDIEDFLKYFETSQEEVFYIHSADTDAVKVMSIHKAKGLGFPVVIVPFLKLNVEIGSSTRRGRVPYVLRPEGDALSLLRLDTKYASFSPDIRNIYRQEYKKAFIDELNAIYVAFTRAEYELYIFIPYQKSGKNLTKLLIPEEHYLRGEKRVYPREKTEEDALPVSLPLSRYRNWIEFLKEEFEDAVIIQNREQILKGEVLHYILSFMGNLKGRDKKEMVKEAFIQAKLKFPAFKNFDEARVIVEKLLSASELKKFFYLDEGRVYQEKELVTRKGETKRIDKLIIKKGQVWIIDYKSAEELIFDYQRQMREYIELVRELYPGKKVKGFLIFLDNLRVEVIDG